MNPSVWFYDQNNSVKFLPLPDNLGLPFPLYLNNYWRYFIAISLAITLIQGAKLRKIIILFICSPETKVGPINTLILMDQINGLVLAAGIIMRVTFILSPVPMCSVVGTWYCWLANFTGNGYIAGSYIWGCYIALFRVLYIKAQDWLKNKIGIENLLLNMLIAGISQVLLFAISLALTDNENSTKKMCAHLSDQDLDILDGYKVNLIKIIIYL